MHNMKSDERGKDACGAHTRGPAAKRLHVIAGTLCGIVALAFTCLASCRHPATVQASKRSGVPGSTARKDSLRSTPIGISNSCAHESGSAIPDINIVDKPIRFDSVRLALTKEYSLRHYGSEITTIVPRMIVIHYTSSNSFSSAYNEFLGPRLSGRENLTPHGLLNVSAHFIVDRDGTIYRMMPETLMGRHTIGLNYCAIGIENVGEENLAAEQLGADEQLVRYLVRKYPTIEYLIGHRESGEFRGSAIYVEREEGYYAQAADPSRAFLSQLRAKLADLALDTLPRAHSVLDDYVSEQERMEGIRVIAPREMAPREPKSIMTKLTGDFNRDGIPDIAALCWRSRDKHVVLLTAVSKEAGYLGAVFDEGGFSDFSDLVAREYGIELLDSALVGHTEFTNYLRSKSGKGGGASLPWSWEPYLPGRASDLHCCFGVQIGEGEEDIHFWSDSNFVVLHLFGG